MFQNPTTAPAQGVNPLRTLTDWRDAIHRAVTAVMAIVATYQVSWADPNGAFAVTWLPAILGVVDAALSIGSAQDRRRRTIYALLGVAQLALVAIGWATSEQAVMIAGFVVAGLNSVYASQWTATSPVTGATSRR